MDRRQKFEEGKGTLGYFLLHSLLKKQRNTNMCQRLACSYQYLRKSDLHGIHMTRVGPPDSPLTVTQGMEHQQAEKDGVYLPQDLRVNQIFISIGVLLKI